MQTDRATTAADTPRTGLSRLLASSLVRYLLVGGLSFALRAAILVALREGAKAPILLAATAAFWTALLFNFTLNRLWSFGGRDDVTVSFVKYLLLAATNWAGTLAIHSIGKSTGAPYVAVDAVAVAVTVSWNYLAYRFWVFR